MQKQQQNYIDGNFDYWLGFLSSLVSIPSISTEKNADRDIMNTCALHCRDILAKTGLETIEVIHHKVAPPYIFAKKIIDPDLPTVLFYAHYDIQPIMSPDKWNSPPFQTRIDNNRIYGRGCADDKGAVILHAATIASFFQTDTPLPVNIKVLLEGEEEAGSPNLKNFLSANQSLLGADCVIIPDMCNLNFKNPSLTTSLRGIVQAEVTVKTAESPLHSGLFGNIALDPVEKLSSLIQKLTKREKGALLSLIDQKANRISREQEETLQNINCSQKEFMEAAGLMPGIKVNKSPAELLAENWRKSSLNITAFSAGDPAKPANVILPEATACFSIRIPPGISPEETSEMLNQAIKNDALENYSLKITGYTSAPAWESDTNNNFFTAMKSSMLNSFKEPIDIIGSGATIPLADIFQQEFPDAQIILTGIEDPASKAHGENESLDLNLLRKLLISQVIFLNNLKK